MSKFNNYNSTEYQLLKQHFKSIPMMDTYIANIIEEYIYSKVKEYYPNDEIVISDGGSTDQTIEYFSNLIDLNLIFCSFK